MQRVYLDNNATTPLLPEVFEAMRPHFVDKFGNASSIHQQGQQARAAVERAREQVSELVNCRPAEIVFTSGGTEGDNLALFGIAKPGDHIITSAIEHHAILNSCKRLEDLGCAVTSPSGRQPRAGGSRQCAACDSSGDQADQHHARQQRDWRAAASERDRQNRDRCRCLLPYRRGARCGQDSAGCAGDRLRSADHLGAQVPRAARSARCSSAKARCFSRWPTVDGMNARGARARRTFPDRRLGEGGRNCAGRIFRRQRGSLANSA